MQATAVMALSSASELAGALRTGEADERRRWADRLKSPGWRLMATVEAAGRRTRELTYSCRYEEVDDGGEGPWCRFAVALASPESGLAHVRRVTLERW